MQMVSHMENIVALQHNKIILCFDMIIQDDYHSNYA